METNPMDTPNREEELLRRAAVVEERIRQATEAANRLSASETGTVTPAPTPLFDPAIPQNPPVKAPVVPPTAPKPKSPEKVIALKTPEEIANDETRKQYFISRDKKNAPTAEQLLGWGMTYEQFLQAWENNYRATKNKIVEGFLAKGEKEKAQEFLLREVELKRKNDLENGFAGKGERFVAGVSKGIEKWDNWGKAEGMKGYLQRLAKTGVSLAMIGAISGLSVEGLAKIGIGTASAVGGGITKYLGRRIAFGTGLSAIMAKVPDDKKKWVQATLIAGSVGLAVAGGGLIAGGALVASSAVGLTLARLTKKYDKNIEASMQKAKEGKIDLATLEADVGKMEKEIETALKQAEKARMWGKIREGAVAVAGSMATLEIMGGIHDYNQHKIDVKQEAEARHQADERAYARMQHDADLKHQAELKAQQEAGAKQDNPDAKDATTPTAPVHIEPIKSPIPSALNAEASATAPDVSHPEITHESSISFDHGKGAIQGILDLKAQIRHDYPDISKAPQSVQDFMHTDATKEAMKLGLFDPSATDGKESALVGEGSVLKLDIHGNITLHDTLTGNDNVLVHGDTSQAEHYGGKMFHSGHHDVPEKTAETPTATEKNYSEMRGGYSPVEGGYSPQGGTTPVPESAPQYAGVPLDEYGQPIDIPHAPEPVHIGEPVSSDSQAHAKALSDGLRERMLNWERGNSELRSQAQPSRFGLGGPTNSPVLNGGNFQHFFPGLSEHQNLVLNTHPEFAHNPFNLNGERLMQTYQVYQENISHILNDNNHITANQWESIKDLKAISLLNNNDYGANHPVMEYLNKLQDTSGLKPHGGIFRHNETTGEYIARALQKIAKEGNLNQLKNFRVE